MFWIGVSDPVYMRPITPFMIALFSLALGMGSTAQAGAPSPAETIPAYSRDANGIALAVTELLPALDNCVASHQALGGSEKVELAIAFAVGTEGEVANFTIQSPNLPATGIDSCIEGTLSAMRFNPGATAIPVQLPLLAGATTEGAVL
ncbi:MAG: hypothetical protein CL930_11510 [Deltaproteobacteria bacterium]|nr:hypothetical protein [Deltaproteobacteria bacterium]